MVIKQTLTVEVEEGDGLIGYLESLQESAQEIAQEVAAIIEPQALEELSTPAPAVKYPIQWTSEKQRRAFFATDGFGRGIPTQRTGAVREGWRALIIPREGGAFGFVIENRVPYARYVYGSLAQDLQASLRFKQRFHTVTGWQNASETVSFWIEAFDELFRERLDEQFQELAKIKTKKRAYTSKSRI